MAQPNLEERVTALEADVLRLKGMLEDKSRRPWWREIAGTFKDDPAYEEAMKLGRKYRESTRPKPRRKKKV